MISIHLRNIIMPVNISFTETNGNTQIHPNTNEIHRNSANYCLHLLTSTQQDIMTVIRWWIWSQSESLFSITTNT